MASLDCQKAWESLAKAHERALGFLPDDALASRIRRLQAVERSLWEELVDKDAWAKAAGQSPPRSSEAFASALRPLLPGVRRRSVKDCSLLAACMINRGDDPRYVNIDLNVSVKDLSRYIPEKEFANERKSAE